MLVEVTEPEPEALALPAPVPVSVGRAAFGRFRTRGRPLALTAGGLLVVAIAIFWVMTALVPSRRLQGEVEQARARVTAAREAAMKVEANHLATGLLDAAAAKERDAERLVKDGRLGAAVEMLREATARYDEAGRAARASVEQRANADQARADMLAAKERAAAETAEFKEGISRASEGDGHYRKLAFQEAAESFRTAARLFAAAPTPPLVPGTSPPAPTPPAPAPAPDATAAAEIREMLTLYARVFAAKDLALLQRIRPGIRPEELSSLSRRLRPDAELQAESEGRSRQGEWRRGRGEGSA